MVAQGVLVHRPAAAWLMAIACLAGCSASVPPAASTSQATPQPAATITVPEVGSATPSPAATADVLAATPSPVAIPAVPVVATQSPAPTVAPPSARTDPAPHESPAPAGQSKEVLGFFLPGQMDYVLHTSDFSVLSTIAFFGISANKQGGLHRTSHGTAVDWRWKAWTGSKMTQIINKAHAAGTKVVLTVTRFSWTSNTYDTTVQMLSKSANRARLARETAQAVIDRGVDGVNVDFEPIPGSQKANFVDFVRRLRTELDARKHGLQLTVDSTGYIANYDVAGLTAQAPRTPSSSWRTTTPAPGPSTRPQSRRCTAAATT